MNHPMVDGRESVFIVTDRGTYIAGENVWFSMYVRTSGRRNIPSSMAGYAEIMNISGMPVAQCRIRLSDNGTGNGVLALPDSLSSGDYLVRGYTRAMTPYGPEHFFSGIIRVFNPYTLSTEYTMIRPPHCQEGPAVELFPEGGTLIRGKPSALVIRTSGPDRKGVAATTVLSYGNGKESDTVVTGGNGLGSLMVPADARWVRAVAFIDSAVVTGKIDGNSSAGYSLRLTRTHDGDVGITVHHDPLHDNKSEMLLALTVINSQGVAFLRRIRQGTEEVVFNIPQKDLVSGINQCLLYDHYGRLLSSRLFMNNSNEEVPQADEEVTITAGEGELRVSLPENSLYLTASAAISENGRHAWHENYAMLAEWVTAGTLADPFMQPFLSGEKEIIDDLLVTLRDRYQDVDHAALLPVEAETQGLAVDCMVTAPDGLGPVKDEMLFINLPGKECFLQYMVTNHEGRLTFIVPERTGWGEIVVYPADTTRNLIIKTLSPFFPGAIPLAGNKADITSVADASVNRMSLNSQVMMIYQISDTDTLPAPSDTLTGSHFYGSPGQRLVLADYVALPVMEEFFFELIPGWDLVRTRSGYEFRLTDPVSSAPIKTAPLMFIDGTCTTDAGTVAMLSPYITGHIDVCNGSFRLGDVLLPPIVHLVTRDGDYRLQSLPSHALRIRHQFTSPEVRFRPFTGDPSGHMPKFDNTLLWAPTASTVNSTKLTFTLPRPDYNSPVTLHIAITGKDGSIRFYSRTIEPDIL
ncbi:MAG: hypothetical protein GX622_03390 [Bacteroidales bacterium]|nr:hypothetical protein [Bacteroidales bacterium]